jgi:hypothetical protein
MLTLIALRVVRVVRTTLTHGQPLPRARHVSPPFYLNMQVRGLWSRAMISDLSLFREGEGCTRTTRTTLNAIKETPCG